MNTNQKLDLPSGCTVLGPVQPGFETILTREALEFVAELPARKYPHAQTRVAGGQRVGHVVQHAFDKLGAFVAALPMVTVLVLIWLYVEDQTEQKIANHVKWARAYMEREVAKLIEAEIGR